MRKSDVEFALPVAAKQVPGGPDWLHEIKHDGYRMKVIRENDTVRLKSISGSDCAKRYPSIVEAALKIKRSRFILDGEAVVLNLHGISDFDALHPGQFNEEVQFYAFDMLVEDDDDLRRLRLMERKQRLEHSPS